MANIGEPQRTIEVVPLNVPVPERPEETPQPQEQPELVPQKEDRWLSWSR